MTVDLVRMKLLHFIHMLMCVKMVLNSSPNGRDAAFDVYQNSDRFKLKFSCLGDWYDVFTVNIATF